MNTANINIRNMELTDLFIKEEFLKVKFESLTTEEQKAHTQAVSKVVMDHILYNPLGMFCMPVDKFERYESNEAIIEKYLANNPHIIMKKKGSRRKNP